MYMAIHMHLNSGMVCNSITLTIMLALMSMGIQMHMKPIFSIYNSIELERKLSALMCMGIHMHLKPLF
jgi:hypothetical protein